MVLFFILKVGKQFTCVGHLAVSRFRLLPRVTHQKADQHAGVKQHEAEYLYRAGEELSECNELGKK